MPKTNFNNIQDELTQAIRSKTFQSLSGVEDRRLNIYRELFYNNIESFISGTFPVLKECTSLDKWQKIVRCFFIEHEAKSPYFLEISEEFLIFLAADTENTLELPAYAYALAHWEWMELFADAYIETQDNVCSVINLERDILTTIECAWLQAYEYAVHKIEVESGIEQAPTFLLIYRDMKDEVGFIELNPLSYLLFEALQNNTQLTVENIVQEIATSHAMPLQQLLAGAYETISQWADLKLIKQVS
jgi:hypothetical protein